MKNKNIDILLKRALKSTETPEKELIEKVKYEFLEEKNISMNKTFKRSFVALAASIMAIVLIGTTAFAAWYFLNPSEVAQKFENAALSAAFKSDTAVNINKSIVSGNYKFTLLAAVAGKDITDMPYYNSDEIQNDRTYAVIAIQNADGTAISEGTQYDTSFFASPLIKGLEPLRKNVVGMNDAGYSQILIDGVLYRITECDNMEIFADCGLYFAICTGTFFEEDAFIYNEQTGEIKTNENFIGSSAIFDLPLYKKLADPVKAEQYLKDQDKPTDNETEDDSSKLFDDIDWEKAVPVEKTIQKITVDADSAITFTYDFEYGSGTISADFYEHFSNDKTEQTAIISMMASDDNVYAVRVTKDADGTLTGVIVMPAS